MRLRPALLCAALLAPYGHASAAPKVPLSAFVQDDTYSKPRLAPDGKHIAVTARIPSGGRTVPIVMIYTLPELKITGAIRMPAFEMPANYLWVSNTRLAITKAKELGSREQPVLTGEVLAVNFDGSQQEYLYGYDMFRSSRRGDRYGDDYGYGEIVGVPQERNGHLFVDSHLWRSSHSLLYDIDTTSATRKLVADLAMPDLGFVMQRDGKPRFAYGTGEDGYAVMFRHDDTGNAWTKLDNLGRRYVPMMFDAGDKSFIARYSANGGPDTLVREHASDGTRTTLFESPNGSVTGLQFGADDLPFAASSSVGVPSMRYFDENHADAKLHKLLSQQFPGSVVSFVDFSADGNLLLFGASSDRDPGSYYLFNRATGKADLLFSAMEAINPDDMAPRQPISFTARDGAALYGFLTMPPHPAGAKVPLVLMPHGGPHNIYDSWYFDTDAQFLASRGYAVLQVNYRGSGGRGLNFEYAGYHQWGGKIQDDLVDGLKATIAQGEVDGARVCVYGGSFGGYSALMLAAREPSLFKCAVGYAGVYDLGLMYKSDEAQHDKRFTNILKRYIGTDKQELDRYSPVNYASQIKLPVLLVHGGKDKRAPVEQAEAMRDALAKAGNAPEWLLAPAEGHGFYDTANLTAFYQKLEAFLARHIGK
ncbi:S9 family peptidase [Massilia solisilvae]|uniref:S9 family peptidase n=1 Tax=Massilia solisilvae TaxID=1811225 RepID=A0ABT2BGD6_9BURK|nr:S9 family peptidase [Massilia solisilvae]MCS0607492.1 S9 family peptidase [Massilia solisilvae]